MIGRIRRARATPLGHVVETWVRLALIGAAVVKVVERVEEYREHVSPATPCGCADPTPAEVAPLTPDPDELVAAMAEPMPDLTAEDFAAGIADEIAAAKADRHLEVAIAGDATGAEDADEPST